jgi:hypothetical protein
MRSRRESNRREENRIEENRRESKRIESNRREENRIEEKRREEKGGSPLAMQEFLLFGNLLFLIPPAQNGSDMQSARRTDLQSARINAEVEHPTLPPQFQRFPSTSADQICNKPYITK